MGKASPALAAFNAGEMAPQLEARVDEEKYANGAHIQQNFIALKQGPSTFRQGTAYAAVVKQSSQRTWLQRFEFSQTQAFVIEFGGNYCRFYTNHGPLLSTGVAAYNNATAYVIGNTVLNGGIQYYCTAPTTGNAPPNSTYWYAMPAYNGSATVAIYEIPSPYTSADLTDELGEFALQIEQSGDVLYIAGGYAGAGPAGVGYPPYQLTRFANAPPNWQFTLYAPTDGPFADALPIVPNKNIALGISGIFGSGLTVTAYGGNVFAATDVGRLVRIGSQFFNTTPWENNVAWGAGARCSNNGHNYIAMNAATSGASAPVHTLGAVADGIGGVQWLYTDSGYGVAEITAYVSPTQVTVNVLLQFPVNVQESGTGALITGITNANPCVVSAVQIFQALDPVFIYGAGGMTQINQQQGFVNLVANGGQVTLAGVDSTSWGAWTAGGNILRNVSIEWQLGAWSNTTEWPRALAFFKDRLFWGGKLGLWGSVPGLYNSQAPDEFGQQTTDSAINEIVSGADASNITWLSPAIILLIGTEGGEYGLDAANYSTSPLGPSNIEVLRQSQWRCRHIRPWLVGSTVLYVQRAGRKVFAMDYNFYLNRYDSTDQNKLSYHISVGGITALAYQAEPWSVLWAVRTDGALLSYTFNREDQVTAWCRHNLGNGGIVESIAVIPAPDGLRDELWMIVNRTINGQTVRTVEYMVKPFEGPQAGQAGDAQSSCWYVDCGVQSVVPGTTEITGLPSVFWNQSVAILADGGVQPRQTVSGTGSLTLAGPFTTVTVGFPYQGNLVPMRPEGGADTGTAQGKIKSGPHVVLRLVDSCGGVIGQLSNVDPSTGHYVNPLGLQSLTMAISEPIQTNDPDTPLDTPPPIRSGDVPISFPLNQNSDDDYSSLYMLVQQNDPLPMTVCGLFPEYKVESRQ